jgi:8-oxo-dGTP diphosphatase
VTSVVGAAIVRHGRLLAAHRRTAPVGWEFPGGKVEDGESDAEALVRECREELGVGIEVADLLGEVEHASIVLRVYLASLLDGEPQPLTDHDELRWCSADELDGLDWLPADRPVLSAARGELDQP